MLELWKEPKLTDTEIDYEKECVRGRGMGYSHQG